MRPQYPLLAVVAATEAALPGDASYIVPTAFPTSVYSSYYGETDYPTTVPGMLPKDAQVLTVGKSSRDQHKNHNRLYTTLF